jgi:hypothetical protein
METVIDYVKRRLRECGPGTWEQIAAECGVAKTLPRKIVYGDRENPGVQTVQPLLTYLLEVERGARHVPSPAADSSAPEAATATAGA